MTDVEPCCHCWAAGDATAAFFEQQSAAEPVVHVVSATSSAELPAAPDSGPIDVLIYECPSVNGTTRRRVDALRKRMGADVDRHYRQQIEKLEADDRRERVREALESCHQDELSHRDEARQLGTGAHGIALRLWLRAVAIGSAVGVAVARRV